jgi:hypothetical protein
MYIIYISTNMPMGNPFRRSNNAKLLSTANTNRNQGGGNKKAGLVPTAALPAAVWIGYNNRGLPKTAVQMAFTLNPNVKQSRPMGGNPLNYYGKFDNF